MLQAQFLKRVLDWPDTPCLKVGESLADAFHGFDIVLPLPFERRGGVLSMPVSVVVQLHLAFW